MIPYVLVFPGWKHLVITKFWVSDKTLFSTTVKWEHDFPLQHSRGNRQRHNWSMWTTINPGLGNVKSIYGEQQCSLAEDSEHPEVDHYTLASEHTTSYSNDLPQDTHLILLLGADFPRCVLRMFPVRNVDVDVNRTPSLCNSLWGWGWFWNNTESCIWKINKISCFRGTDKDFASQ